MCAAATPRGDGVFEATLFILVLAIAVTIRKLIGQSVVDVVDDPSEEGTYVDLAFSRKRFLIPFY